jgi:hypothetical protein
MRTSADINGICLRGKAFLRKGARAVIADIGGAKAAAARHC